ncbi:MAG: Gfo/Idh/MocA family oxidoreductase [Clostridia bacterium]|nr:Gfo/Idh/MocA family oxidoreductase [Clostridia bacterium]
MIKKIKWGVIGCGGIADRRTLPGMMLADNAELLAVMDTNREAAERCKEKYSTEYAFDKVEDLLALDEIQAVYIASPVFCHLQQVKAAARAGKHILLEKPLGLDVREAEEIADFCHKAGVKLSVGLMMRFHCYHQKLRELIEQGALGEIVSARGQFTCWFPEMKSNWRQEKHLSGGGALMDLSIHSIDLLRYITGLEVVEVAGIVGNQIFKYNIEDAGSVMMRFSNGAIGYVDSNFNVPDVASKSKLEIYGTKGCAVLHNTLSQVEGGQIEIIYADDSVGYDAMQNREDAKSISVEAEFGNMYTKEIEAFSESVIHDSKVAISAEDAIRSQKIVEAAYASSAQRKFIKI